MQLRICQRPRPRLAFTLVELLVVIAIVAVLASLLLPSLGSAKTAAVSAKCKSNLRQIGIHLSIYVGDHGVYPHYAATPTGFADPVGWPAIASFADPATRDESRPFRCPSTRGARQWAGNEWTKFGRSYGYNADGFMNRRAVDLQWGLGGKPDARGFPTVPVKDSEVVSPAEMLAIGDAFGSGPETNAVHLGSKFVRRDPSPNYGFAGSLEVWRASARSVEQQHDRRANVGFADLHVEGMRLRSLFSDPTDSALSRWNRDQQPHR